MTQYCDDIYNIVCCLKLLFLFSWDSWIKSTFHCVIYKIAFRTRPLPEIPNIKMHPLIWNRPIVLFALLAGTRIQQRKPKGDTSDTAWPTVQLRQIRQ